MSVITKTLKTSGGDYSTLAAWEAGEQTDLVTDGNSHVLECYTGAYNGAVTISGWTTGPSNRITIKAAAGEEHNGVFRAGVDFNTTSFGDGLAVVETDIGYITLQDLGIYQTKFRCALKIDAEPGIVVQRCILEGEGSSGASVGGGVTLSGSGEAEFDSCILAQTRDSSSVGAARYSRSSSGVATFYNCTFLGYNGIYCPNTSAPPIPLLKNCVFATGVEGIDGAGGVGALIIPAEMSHNAFWAGQTAHGTNTVTGIGSADFTDFANDDLSIDDTSSLYDVGTDLSAEFTEDIAGDTITTWSIGAFTFTLTATGVTGSGDIQVQDSVTAGSGSREVVASGNTASSASVVQGSGTRTAKATGAIQVALSTTLGTGTRSITGAGVLTAQDSTSSGSGEITEGVTGTGDIQAQEAIVQGLAKRTITGAGIARSSVSIVQGTGELGGTISGSGEIVSAQSFVQGTGSREVTAIGVVRSLDSATSGTGIREITGTGSIASGPSRVKGYDTVPVFKNNTITKLIARVKRPLIKELRDNA